MSKLFLTLVLASPVALAAQSFDGLSTPAQSSSQTSQSSSMIASTPADPSNANPSNAAAPAEMSSAPAPAAQSPDGFMHRGVFGKRRKEAPVASFTASYVYTYTQDIAGHSHNLMGWSAVPEVNFTKYLGLQADFGDSYVRSINPGQRRLVMAAGPRINFAPRSKFTPFIYMEGGEVRLTTDANSLSDWNPVAKGGIGFDFKMKHGFGLQLIPGEYQGQYMDNGAWGNSFVSRIGINFALFK